jgi:hypothetical protein
MKKLIFMALLFFAINLNAQVSEFTSFQSSIIKKDNKGEFQNPNEWISKKMKIALDLNKNRIQLFSKALLDRDPWVMEQEIQLNKLKPKSGFTGKEDYAEFSGTDKSGEKCTVRLNFSKEVNDINDGLMRIEYSDVQELYKIRKNAN